MVCGGACSALFAVLYGLVHGSYDELSAFPIFINDLCKVLPHAELSLFADDGKFIGDVSTQERRRLMQADLDAVADCLATNRLPINPDKSCVLHYDNNAE